MEGASLNSNSTKIQTTSRVSAISTEGQVSEVNSATIKSMVASLKILGFEKLKRLCENKLIQGVTEDDIRNLIFQLGLDENQVKIDWLLTLNKTGVGKIQKIIEDLQRWKIIIFQMFHGNSISPTLFREQFDWSFIFCNVLEIYLDNGCLCLREEFLIANKESILLDPAEMMGLFKEELSEVNARNVFDNDSTLGDILIDKIINEANHSELKVAGREELHFLFSKTVKGLAKNEQLTFIKANTGFFTQIMLKCFRDTEIMSELNLQQAGALLMEFVKLPQDLTQSYHVDNSLNLVNFEEVNNTPELHKDVQGVLFEYMSSINAQWNFAITSKANLQAYAVFCTSNLKNDPQIDKLKKDGLSEIQIFMHYPRLRKDRFVPLCPAGLNSLAYEVLGPNTIELIKKGMLLIIDAKKIVADFNEEMNGKDFSESGPERYRRDGSLSQMALERMSLDELGLLLGNRLVQFAINSLQLTIEQAIVAKECFSYKHLWGCLGSQADLWRSAVPNEGIDFLFVSGKLPVKRFLKLSHHHIKFLCESSIFSYIQEDKITVELALFIADLLHTYEQSGWYGLNLLIRSNESELETY